MSAGGATRSAALHLGISEQGKVHALAGDHCAALAHYREAMRRAVAEGAPEVFFRHYLECSLESLERMGSLSPVLEYCDRAIAHYAAHPPANEVARRDLAAIHARRGVVLLKSGERAGAEAALRRACELAGAEGVALPLAATLLRWIAGGLHLSPDRVLLEQERTGYFAVRAGTVDPRRAVQLPDEIGGRGGRGHAR